MSQTGKASLELGNIKHNLLVHIVIISIQIHATSLHEKRQKLTCNTLLVSNF